MLLIGTNGEYLGPRISLLILDPKELPMYSLSEPRTITIYFFSCLSSLSALWAL